MTITIARILRDVFFLRFGSPEQVKENRAFFRKMLYVATALYAAIGMHAISLGDSVDVFGMNLKSDVSIMLFYEIIACFTVFGWSQIYAVMHMAEDIKNHPEGFYPQSNKMQLTQEEQILQYEHQLMHELLRDYGLYSQDFENRDKASQVSLLRLINKNKALQEKLTFTQENLSDNRRNNAFKQHFDTNIERLRGECRDIQGRVYRTEQDSA